MKEIYININNIYKILGSKFLVEILFLIFCNFLATILDLVSFSIILPMIALLTQNGLTEKYEFLIPLINFLGNPSKAELLKDFFIFMILLYIFKNIFLGILNLWQYRFVNNVQVKVSNKLLEVYLYQPYDFFFERNTTKLFKNVAHEVGQFENFILQILQLSTEVPIVLGIIFILFKVDPIGTFFILSASLISAIVYFLATNNFIKKIGFQRIAFFEKSNQFLMEGLNGIKELKVLGVEKVFLNNYSIYHKKFSKLNYFNSSMANYPKLWLEITTISCVSIYLIYIINDTYELANILPFLSIFTISSFRLMPSFAKISSAIQNLTYRGGIIKLIYEELNLPRLEFNSESYSSLPFTSEITLRNIDFNYKSSEVKVLKSINLTIKKNSSVGFIGQSGSGKSTLIDLIIGLIKPVNGGIFVDNININSNEVTLNSWLKNIGYVPQFIYLIDDSLLNNIALGVAEDDINLDNLRMALNVSCLDELVKTLPNGLSTLVGERGVRLSGGQRQRIGIARALYRNPPILILDEATSALDSKTELNVMNNINSLGNKTLLLIAHRISTLNKCDQLISLDLGSLSIIK